MALAEKIQDAIERSSWIRKMFEEGARLKALYGADKVFDFSLGNPDFIVIVSRNNTRRPMVGELAELVSQIDLCGRSVRHQ